MVTNKQKSLSINAFLNGLRTFLNLIFPLITFPYITNVLSVDGIGKYNFALSINQYFLLIAGLGISVYAVREGTKYRDTGEKLNQFASEIFSINLISTFFAYVLLFLSMFFVPKLQNYSVIIFIFSIELIFTTIGTEWIYTIFEEYSYITFRSILFKIISIVLLFLLVKNPDDYIIYAIITVFANVGSNVLNFFHAKKFCSISFVLNKDCLKYLKPILIIFASTLASSIYVNSDITMLGFMVDDYEVGIYSVSSKIYRIVKQMLSSVLIVSIPRLAYLMGQNKLNEYRNTLTNIFNALVILVLPAMIGLFVLSDEIIYLISNTDYIGAASSLRLLSIALIFCIFGWFFNQCVLIPAKKEKIVLWATTISAVTNIFINLFLIPLWKSNAVAFSTIIAEFIMTIFCVYNGLKIVTLKKSIWPNLISVFVGCICIYILCFIVKILSFNNVYTIVISIFLSVLGYFICLYICKNQIIRSFVNKYKK